MSQESLLDRLNPFKLNDRDRQKFGRELTTVRGNLSPDVFEDAARGVIVSCQRAALTELSGINGDFSLTGLRRVDDTVLEKLTKNHEYRDAYGEISDWIFDRFPGQGKRIDYLGEMLDNSQTHQ